MSRSIQVTLPVDVVAIINKQRLKEKLARGWKPTRGFVIEEAIRGMFGKPPRTNPRPKQSRNAAAGASNKRTHRGSVERSNTNGN